MIPTTVKCDKCGYDLIEEEVDIHICKHVLDYRIEDNILWLYDGQIWYPRKLISQPDPKHPFKTPEGSTEPKICVVIWKSIEYLESST